ncbi:MAG: hypothetical protein EBU67_04575 [Actinobacteria bacterium]|nr:hypothetical protein [Actinomycetota bacterium]
MGARTPVARDSRRRHHRDEWKDNDCGDARRHLHRGRARPRGIRHVERCANNRRIDGTSTGDAASGRCGSTRDHHGGHVARARAGPCLRDRVSYRHLHESWSRPSRLPRHGSTLATGARLIVVFGCGGDRDATKRPVMGAVASELADVVVVTTDNARSEDPAAIANEVVRGAGRPDSIRVVLDRRDAINGAIATAQSGDVVVIAGKGHERGQTIGTVTVDFDDMDEARGALLRVMGGAN